MSITSFTFIANGRTRYLSIYFVFNWSLLVATESIVSIDPPIVHSTHLLSTVLFTLFVSILLFLSIILLLSLFLSFSYFIASFLLFFSKYSTIVNTC